MFFQARLKLTILYSVIFLVLFWTTSIGTYVWMNRYYGDESRRQLHSISFNSEQTVFDNNHVQTESPSDRAMDELRNVLLILDIGLLFGIPLVTWFLTGAMLDPVQKANEMEKQFLTDASHDLRTPLSILSGNLEVTLQKDRSKEGYKQILKSNKEEVDDLITLVENMLFLSREEKNNKTVKMEPIDLTDLLAERVSIFSENAKQKKIKLSFSPPEASIVVWGNHQLLKRVFTGLLDNAIKYTPEKGSVETKLFQEQKLAVVEIKDTGIGIPEKDQEKVFDRFFRTDSSRNEKGYGLGLSIAKQIITMHKGKIEIGSKPNQGTTVTIHLPTV